MPIHHTPAEMQRIPYAILREATNHQPYSRQLKQFVAVICGSGARHSAMSPFPFFGVDGLVNAATFLIGNRAMTEGTSVPFPPPA